MQPFTVKITVTELLFSGAVNYSHLPRLSTVQPPDDEEWMYELHSTHRETIIGGIAIVCVWKASLKKGAL